MAFQNASQFSIGNATFSADTHNVTVVQQPVFVDPMKILHDNRAVEATHTSTTAAYAPKCKPGSREQVIQDITSWAREPKQVASHILWFQGPAGGGKTCIMREVALRLQETGTLAASYFFSTRVTGLDTERPFMATIVHQLLGTENLTEAGVVERIMKNPTIFTESLDTQMEALVMCPLKWTGDTTVGQDRRPCRVIVIDGLDECRDKQGRAHILRLMRKLATSKTIALSFTIIIASRPELDIRTIFSNTDFKQITRNVCLQDYDGAADIRNSLCDEFNRIRETHPGKESIPEGWPAEEILELLVSKSSGCYIYPATVIKHVDNPRRNPVSLLQEVLAMSKSLAPRNPLEELDALYAHILNPPDTDILLMKRLLHCIIAINEALLINSSKGVNMDKSLAAHLVPAFLDSLLQIPPGSTNITFCDLHSLIAVPQFVPKYGVLPETRIRFHHKTLEDYLCSPRRSGHLYQPLHASHLDLATSCAQHVQRWSPEESPCSTEVGYYSCRSWWTHLDLFFQGAASPKEALRQIPTSLLNFDSTRCWKYELAYTPREKVPLSIWTHLPSPEQIHEFIVSIIQTVTKAERMPNLLRIANSHSAPSQQLVSRYAQPISSHTLR
ncbi:hypothetical protein D9611_009162 [Ephemerocybe angulata]|uniref:Nephrocystin 3-like N-terminal domain-containing protein n=1 Tax=Ephemerocybe angulata TaxID=980116 RepID=A0A8H5CDR8_9AGAR|nr:hypothetical protein D9611_009162 [Tulosesus angulatus]